MTISNSIVLADGAFGTLASSLAITDTTLAFTTGHGARFPAVVSGQVMYLCLINSGNVVEEVKITAHVDGSDSATMTRAANGTSAKAWNAGDRVEARLSSEILERLQTEAVKVTALVTGDSGATYTGSMSNTALGYVTGMVYEFSLGTTNNGTAPTIAIDGLSAITVKSPIGAALGVGDMPLNGFYLFDGSNFLLMNPIYALGLVATTAMLFMQTTAPTGWTKSSTHNDKVLRIVSGAASSGGTTSFSSIFGSGRITGSTAADLSPHTHTMTISGSFTAYDNGGAQAGPAYSSTGDGGSSHSVGTSNSGTSDSSGGGGGHTHTVSLDIQYADVIVATKN